MSSVATPPRRLSRDDIVRLGQSGRAWDFVPVAMKALAIALGDVGVRVLCAANLARLGLRTAALEQLDLLEGDAADDPSVAELRRAAESMPDDRISRQTAEETCRRNVERLAARGVDLRREFGAWCEAADGTEWFGGAVGNVARRRGREWTLWGDHRAAAERFAGERFTVAQRERTHRYVVEGADPPWMLLKVVEAAARQATGFAARIVVVQADAQEFLDGLALADLPVLAEERTAVFVGPGAAERLAADARARFAWKLDGPYIPLLSVRTPVEGLGLMLQQLDQEQAAEEKRLLAHVREKYRGRDGVWWRRRYAKALAAHGAQRSTGGTPVPQRPGSELRVLIPTTRYSTYIQHSSRDLAAAFNAAGCRAEVLVEPDESTRLSSIAYLRAMAELEPDLVVLINYPRSSLGGCVPPEVPFVLWLQDSMPHQFKSEVGEAQTELDFVIGHLHEELFTQFGFSRERTMAIPVVASEAKFFPGRVDAEPVRRFGCEIAFLSHHSETPEAMHERLRREAGPDPTTLAILEALRPEAVRIGNDPMATYAISALREAAAKAIESVIRRRPDPQAVGAIARQYAVPLADRVMRHQTLAWAADLADQRGWRLNVYGRGWDKHPRFGRYAKGDVAHGEDLRACYQCAAAHLHASITTMVHQRVLECALSGGLPLCRLFKDALAAGMWRMQAELRRDLPLSAFERRNGYLGLPVADHPAAMQVAALQQRLGLEADGWAWIPEQDPSAGAGGPAHFLSMIIPEYDAAWLCGDLAQAAFSSPQMLGALVERAGSNGAWRSRMSALIAGRARQRLTHAVLVKRVLEMIEQSVASKPASRGASSAAGDWAEEAGPACHALAEATASPEWLSSAMSAHRALRKRLGRETDEAAMRRMAKRYRPPAWATGFIGPDDAMFLYDLARCADAERIIEVGTASGVSTAVLLTALHDMGRGLSDENGLPRLHSYDISAWCYFDRTRPVGSAVDDMAPELAGGLIVRTGVGAAEAATDFARRPVSLAFVDANHSHPWPIADVLALQPALQPGAWIVLHDIDLPRLAREYEARTATKVDWHQSGVKRLFDAWPGEKFAGEGGGFNIGAVRLPKAGPLTWQDFREALSASWEDKVDETTLKLLGRA